VWVLELANDPRPTIGTSTEASLGNGTGSTTGDTSTEINSEQSCMLYRLAGGLEGEMGAFQAVSPVGFWIPRRPAVVKAAHA
jgi:hypothetical protein